MTIRYLCPVCAYAWDDTFSIEPVFVGECSCPNCEEPVLGLCSSS